MRRIAVILALAIAGQAIAQPEGQIPNWPGQGLTMAEAIDHFNQQTATLIPDAYWSGAAVGCQFRSRTWGQIVLGTIQEGAVRAAYSIWGSNIYKDPKFTGSGDPEGGMNLTSGGGVLVVNFDNQVARVAHDARMLPIAMCAGLRESGILAKLDQFASGAE